MEKAGFEVKIIDSRVDREWQKNLTNELKDAFALGITSMSGPDLKPAMEACDIARGMNNKITVIWGGHHASALPDEILDEGYGDYVVIGPAEYNFPTLLQCIVDKKRNSF
jgi:radical SAM superfamily enzyme YgiQ (UPF0313 family)